MPFTALSHVRHRLAVGRPLPFNVCSADHTLLLARGQVVQSHLQLDELLARGALVELSELQSPRERALHAPREVLPQLWHEGLGRINRTLLALGTLTPGESFSGVLGEASDAVLGLVERDPDLAIFQVLTQDTDSQTDYGARRSLRAAITAYLVAHRLGWHAAALERAFKVALTMNLAMLALQGELASQAGAPTAAQRAALLSHPLRSMEMLMQAGIRDDDWLQAVARHHEHEDGSGYPSGCRDVGELASLVRRADAYTAKLASRVHREALSADQAGRQMFMQDPGHPMTAALVKEFGIYPPGCYVQLASGEVGVVVQRGPTVTSPVVACLSNAQGQPLPAPLRVDTSLPRHAVRAIVGETRVDCRLPLDRLLVAMR